MILRERSANVADRAQAKSEQIGFAVRRVSLKISMQAAVMAGRDERIAGLGKMIHADVLITRVCELLDRIHEELQFFSFGRQILFETSLLALQCRHVGIAEHGQPIRAKVEHSIQGRVERRPGLFGKTVDEIDIDTFEIQCSCCREQSTRLVVWLNSMDCELYLPIENPGCRCSGD